jgi:hypothetical protein
MKKYSNDNIFLNDLNDISRSAYSNKTKNDIPLKNNAFERFEIIKKNLKQIILELIL